MAKNQHTQRRSFILKIQSGVKEMGGQDGQLRNPGFGRSVNPTSNRGY